MTLAVAGIARYRAAVAWGAATTVIGSVVSAWLGRRTLAVFSSGIVAAAPTRAFAVAVLVGAAGWVAVETVSRLPVSSVAHSLAPVVAGMFAAGMFAMMR